MLNISKVAQECAVERKVVENYFTILEDLLIGYRIPVFTKRAKRRLSAHPKFYYFDVGLYRTLRPMGPLDAPEEAQGHAIETLLFQELYAVNDYFNFGYKIYYWRTSAGIKTDFVLYGERGIRVFEVKRTRKVTSAMCRGLKAFLKDYPSAKAYLLYGGDRLMREGDIEIMSIDYALKNLSSIL